MALMENASRAFLDSVRKSMRKMRAASRIFITGRTTPNGAAMAAIGTGTINPELLTAAERIQYEGYQRRERPTLPSSPSRGLVRQILRGQRDDGFRVRESSLEVHLPRLDAQWTAGHRNAAELWRQLKARGFCGALRVVTSWQHADGEPIGWMPISYDDLPGHAIEGRNRYSGRRRGWRSRSDRSARSSRAFQVMIRRKTEADLNPRIERCRTSLVASFANGVDREIQAVRAAIICKWSYGQTEGQITKLKLLKRQMYGRGKLDLLQARLIGARCCPDHQNCVRANIGRRNTLGHRTAGLERPAAPLGPIGPKGGRRRRRLEGFHVIGHGAKRWLAWP